jgi:hypothetical protein
VIKIGSLLCSLTLLLSLLPYDLMAQSETTEVNATVDRNQIRAGEAFTLRVSISSEEAVQVHPPSIPNLPNTQVIHQWASSQTNSSIVSRGQGVEFKTIRSRIFNYQILAEQEGEILIPAISVDVSGTQYRTAPIKIQVSGGGALQQAAPEEEDYPSSWGKDPVDELEERFNQLLNRQFGGPRAGGFMTGPKNEKDAFFILAEVDKTEAFRGEQITASWYLYTRGRVQDIDTLKYPDLKGFWKEDIQISTHLNFEQDVINGIAYNRALLVSYALFPIEAGKALIDPYQAKATIAGGFGFGRGFQATKSSEEIPVLIKPLPEEAKPMDFTGAVGEFQMMVDAPNKTIVAHQPFSLKVRFEGRGNAKLIELPKLELGDKLEVYDISSESNFFKNGQSFKEFNVLLIARQAGDLEIPALKASFFDPKQARYVTLSSQPIRLNILPGAKPDSLGEERLQTQEPEVKTLPVARTTLSESRPRRGSPLMIWGLLFAGVVLWLVGKLLYDLGYFSRPPSLQEVLESRFKEMDELAAKGDWRKLGIQATNTIYFTLGQISGEGGASEELDKVLSKVAPSVRREIEAPLRQLMDYFGVLGFGPKEFLKTIKDDQVIKQKVSDLKTNLNKAAQAN